MQKLIRYAWIFISWRVMKSEKVHYVPEDISIELTNTCNFRCTFCPQSDPEHFNIVTRSTLTPENAAILLDKIRAGGVRTNVMHWTLDGEPFVNKQLGQICDLAIERGFTQFIFSTNGYFCTKERLSELPHGNNVAYQLCIDFCADEALFERHRGTPKSWRRVKGNIERLLADVSLSHIRLQVTDISSFEEKLQKTEAPLDALRGLFPDSDRLRVTGRTFHNATGHVEGLLERKRSERSSIRSKYNLCPYPWTSIVIASNGDVVACCRDLQHKTVLGNLFETDLQEIWNGSEYRSLRRALSERKPSNIEACRGCDMPYDTDKFTFSHILRTAVNRLGILR